MTEPNFCKFQNISYKLQVYKQVIAATDFQSNSHNFIGTFTIGLGIVGITVFLAFLLSLAEDGTEFPPFKTKETKKTEVSESEVYAVKTYPDLYETLLDYTEQRSKTTEHTQSKNSYLYVIVLECVFTKVWGFVVEKEVTVIIPRLNYLNQLIYSLKEYDSKELIDIAKIQSVEANVVNQIAPLVKQRYYLDSDKEAIQKSIQKTQELEALAKSSDIFGNKVDTYSRLREQHLESLSKIGALQCEQDRCIQQALINSKIADANLDVVPDISNTIDLQAEELKQRYQEVKDFISAFEDMKSSTKV